jgi:hypothetical protein
MSLSRLRLLSTSLINSLGSSANTLFLEYWAPSVEDVTELKETRLAYESIACFAIAPYGALNMSIFFVLKCGQANQ